MNELDKVFPPKTEIVVQLSDGTKDTVVAREFTFGQLPQVLRLSEKIYAELSNLSKKDKYQEVIAEVLMIGGDDFMSLLGLSINRDRDWFDKIQIDSAIDVVTAVVEVNVHFFVQRVLPKFEVAAKGLVEKSGSWSSRSSTRASG